MKACGRLLACGVLWLLSGGAVAAWPQAKAPDPATQARLNGLAADIFSTTPHLDDDVRALKEILGADSGMAEAHLLLGIAYRRLGSAEMLGEAVAELRQALALNSELLQARLHLAYIYLDLGRPERARDEMEKALEQAPGTPQLLALEGEAERQQKNPQRAIELTRQALQADPSLAEARYYLALALYDLGQRPAAIREMEQVVQSGQPAPDAYLSLGIAYMEERRYDDALKTLTTGTAVDPARSDLRIQLARAYRLKGSLDKAEEQLRLAVPKAGGALAPSEYRQQQVELDLRLEQGLLALQRGRLANAAATLKKVLAIDPAHGVANRALAEVYLRQGSYRLAAQYAARAERAGSPLSAEEQKLLQQGLHKK